MPKSARSQGDATDQTPPFARSAFLQALQRWSEANARPMPWRACGDAYRVWVSEIMLQQTTVTAVIPYFERFLQRFPTLLHLATAEEADVLRLWEGLGYYSRARNLHAAAKVVMARHDGSFPEDLAALHALPGVGRYTAGAILSFAYNRPAPIVEANTQRLYARLLAEDRPLKSTAVQQRLWELATWLVGAEPVTRPTRTPQSFGPGAINQALTDLGALVCRPVNPDCPHCPVQKFCHAFAEQRQHEIPQAAPRPTLTDVNEATVAVSDNGRYLLRQREPGERWAGLWDFPRFEVHTDAQAEEVLTAGVLAQTGLKTRVGPQELVIKHGVTRYRITLGCHLGTVMGGRLTRTANLKWAALEEFPELALSVTGRKLALWISDRPQRLNFD